MIRPSFLALMDKFGIDTPLNCLEVGVREGFNAVEMLKFAPNITLTLVDPYKDTDHIRKEMLQRLKPWQIKFIHKTSVEASALIKDESLDYVYIDGDHSYKMVTEDINHWFRKVKGGGIIAGHDWGYVHMAVKDCFKPESKLAIVAVQPLVKYFPPQYWSVSSDWWVHKEYWKWGDSNINEDIISA